MKWKAGKLNILLFNRQKVKRQKNLDQNSMNMKKTIIFLTKEKIILLLFNKINKIRKKSIYQNQKLNPIKANLINFNQKLIERMKLYNLCNKKSIICKKITI